MLRIAVICFMYDRIMNTITIGHIRINSQLKNIIWLGTWQTELLVLLTAPCFTTIGSICNIADKFCGVKCLSKHHLIRSLTIDSFDKLVTSLIFVHYLVKWYGYVTNLPV